MRHTPTRRIAATIALALAGCSDIDAFFAAREDALGTSVPIVIAEVYGGGGNSGSVYTNDFVVLFNRSDAPASLSGLSLQYASSAGNFTNVMALAPDVLAPGESYLVQLAAGTTPSTSLPTPDATGTLMLSGTTGKVALALGTSALACGGASACSSSQNDAILDLVGWGASPSIFEGTLPAPATTNSTAIGRVNGGCTDTQHNGADFAQRPPAPRRRADGATPCDADAGAETDASVESDASVEVDAGEEAGPDADVPVTHVHDVQGASHRSPLAGGTVQNLVGVVTHRRPNGFFIEDPSPDALDATSEGIFVFTSSAPSVDIATLVSVDGVVTEYRPGCASCAPSSSAYANLTVTEITSPVVRVLASNQPLPAALVVGPAGRLPPTRFIEDDANGNVELAGAFDPENDGLDFFESLEGMRIVLEAPVAVGPTYSFTSNRELPVTLASIATERTSRGGLLLDAFGPDRDLQPERFLLVDRNSAWVPLCDVGDVISGSIVGLVDYEYGKYGVETLAPASCTPGGLARETVSLSTSTRPTLDVATVNVENLDPLDPPAKFAGLAATIVTRLGAPDLVVLEEMQDDNGATNDGVVSANATANTLIAAITAAGGPTYTFRDIAPSDDQDGGEPGGNIRVGFLFRTDRGLSFVDRGAATSTSAASVIVDAEGATTSLSPGRLDPTNPAFSASRKPLVGEFRYVGRRLLVVANHWNSKGGDEPTFGRFQPPAQSSQTRRTQQADVVGAFVEAVIAVDPDARIIVAGDLNDFIDSPPLDRLVTAGLVNLHGTLARNERYSYVYQGNSQALDHMLASSRLFTDLVGYDVVHVNAEYVTQDSDHDPSVARFAFDPCAAVDATCDGVDDDCSGEADEDFVATATECGVGACADAGATSCVAGELVDDCEPLVPAASDATCNGIDDDCSGQSDEDFVGVATTCGVGACARTGVTVCVSGTVGDACTPGAPASTDATCDGNDDDCSGQSDEDFVGLATTCGVGACASTGVTACVAGAVADDCMAGVPAASDATCDGVDEDCSGQDAEDFVGLATTCGVGACARTGVTECVSGSVEDACEAGAPATSDATCDGVDDDCSGQTDEDAVCGLDDAGVVDDASVDDASVDDASVVEDAGLDASTSGGDDTSGCSCRAGTAGSPMGFRAIALGLLAVVLTRRGRRSRALHGA